MKRTIDATDIKNIFQHDSEPVSKAALVGREANPVGVSLVNSTAVGKRSYTDAMELSESTSNVHTAIQANARNRLDIIGRQMKNLQDLITEVFEESKLNIELHNVACNFVKKPGHVYHLYERPSGQKYFGMLSPEDWQTVPHTYLGSFLLEADLSWTPIKSTNGRYEGLNHLKQMFAVSQALM